MAGITKKPKGNILLVLLRALYIELTIFQGSVNSKTEIMFPAEIVTAVTMLHLQHRDNVVLRDNLISLHYIQYTAEY